MPQLPDVNWSFDGIFGTFDLAAAHSAASRSIRGLLQLPFDGVLHYRDLAGIGLTPAEMKSIAAQVTVP